MMKPPHIPTKSAMMVSSGSMTQVATRRGVTSFWMGSVPSARMASICSVTFMEPSSLAMPEALRPATISAGQHRAEFAHQGERHDRAGLADLPVCARARGHLQRHDGAAEEPGDARDHAGCRRR